MKGRANSLLACCKICLVAVPLIAAAAILFAHPASKAGDLVSPKVASAQAVCDPARLHVAGDFNLTIESGGLTRKYLLHVPPSYTGADPVPLVLNFHGYYSTAIAQQFYSSLAVRADQPDGGFIVVSPEGLPEFPGVPASQHWNHVQFSGMPDDVAFVNDLLDEVESTLCIDPDRVFSTGMSNGGEMTIRLACSLSSRIAAVAPVAGSYYPPFSLTEPPGAWHNSAETCPDTRPMPLITFHGTADTAVPFEGGLDNEGYDYRLAIDNTTPDDDVMQSWAAHNGCTSGRQESTVTSEVRRVTYTDCDDDADVVLYIVDGGGHTWPGSPFEVPSLGYTTHDIDATVLMLLFFGLYTEQDGDGVLDGDDNCPLDYNPAQENTDSGPARYGGHIGNGRSIAGDDATIPNGDSLGDACDPDMDNDGIPDASDSDPGGDITYDDNANGNACVPLGTDAADDGPSWDADCNGVLDGIEGSCPLAVNPTGDDDGDGLLNTWEVCKWGTDPAVQDSDGDTLGDCKEAVDSDGNGIIDFGNDALNSARASLLSAAAFGKDGDFDLNGNNVITGDFGADTLTTAKMSFKLLVCK